MHPSIPDNNRSKQGGHPNDNEASQKAYEEKVAKEQHHAVGDDMGNVLCTGKWMNYLVVFNFLFLFLIEKLFL